jgi:hypothetical protein
LNFLEVSILHPRPKRLTLKGWKRGFFRFRDLYLSYYNTAQEAHGPPIGRIFLKGSTNTLWMIYVDRKLCRLRSITGREHANGQVCDQIVGSRFGRHERILFTL